jgi:hypothetical protein
LREYAQGAAQSNINPVADFIAPTIPVTTQVGFYKKYTEKNRFKIPNSFRGIGGRATRVGFDASDATYNCQPHALDFPVDYNEQTEEASLENMLQEGAGMIAEVGGLEHEKAVIDAAVAATTGGSINIYFNLTTDDPVDTLDAGILTVLKAARYGSLMGIGVVFGATAFKLFKNAFTVRSRFVTAGGNAIPNVTPKAASDLLLGSPETMVSYMIADTAAEGVTPAISFLLDSKILVFARRANPTRRDPSFMKTFRLAGQFMVPGTYVTEDGRGEVAKFDWSEDIQVTNSAAAQLYTVATH